MSLDPKLWDSLSFPHDCLCRMMQLLSKFLFLIPLHPWQPSLLNFKNKWRGSQSGVLVQGWPADHRPHPQRLGLSAIAGVVSTHVLCAQLSRDTNGWTKFIKREAGREVCWPSFATTSCVTLHTFSLSGSPFQGLLPTSLVWLASCFFLWF